MDLDPAIREAAVTLANNTVLPTWMQIPALGRDMTPIAEIAVAAAMPLIARATADAIADKIEAVRPHIPPSYDPKRREHLIQRVSLNMAARIARSFGRTPETDTTEATK